MNWKPKLAAVWLTAFACLVACREVAGAYPWLPSTNKIVLLAVWAHPDDEAIFGGGSLPYYSSVLNLPTMLLCLADGDDVVRQNELRSAAWTYGLRYEPLFGHFNNLHTAAMTNNPYTNKIDACWDLWADGVLQGDGRDVEAGKARAINFVAEQIRRYRPDVIITHDLNGETGHHNHMATAYAVTRAFFVAADPNATATNLAGLAPWQAQKLYVHLYPTNRLFHASWETPYPALTNRTAHQVANLGLTCHVSQGPLRWVGASAYPPGGMYNLWPSEWWGLYASMVGLDTPFSRKVVVKGCTVPAGVAVGDFLEHLPIGELYFTTVPNSATGVAGSSITLSASAVTTVPPLRYQWQHNGVNVVGATGASLTLRNMQPANAGSYTVVATNPARAITSPPAVLTVLVPQVTMPAPQTRVHP